MLSPIISVNTAQVELRSRRVEAPTKRTSSKSRYLKLFLALYSTFNSSQLSTRERVLESSSQEGH